MRSMWAQVATYCPFSGRFVKRAYRQNFNPAGSSLPGTGSNPLVPHGWQREILKNPSQNPAHAPWLEMASMV